MFRHLPDLRPLGTASVTVPSGPTLAPASAPIFECAIGGCRLPRSNHHTGYCEAHTDRYLTHIHEHTRHIGRGELP